MSKRVSKRVPYTTEDFISEQMNDPTFAAAYKETHFEHTFADALWHARKRRGWSQRKLAKRAGMEQSALNRLEKAGVTPTITTVWYLANALGCEARITADGVQLTDNRPELYKRCVTCNVQLTAYSGGHDQCPSCVMRL